MMLYARTECYATYGSWQGAAGTKLAQNRELHQYSSSNPRLTLASDSAGTLVVGVPLCVRASHFSLLARCAAVVRPIRRLQLF